MISRDTDVTVRHYEELSPLSGPSVHVVSSCTVAWSNEKWLQLTEGRAFDQYLGEQTENRLQAWIQGDDNSSVFVLELQQPVIRLHLAKTVVPLSPASSTHAFCVVTSQSRVQCPASTSSDTSSSGPHIPFNRHRSSAASMDMRTSFSTDVSADATSASSGSYFPASGSSQRSFDRRQKSKLGRRSPISDRPVLQMQIQSAAEECWQLVESIDWSKTKLGPRSEWAELVDPLLAVTFQSKTQDSVWLGEDLQIL